MSIYLITLPENPRDLSFEALKLMRRDSIVLYRGENINNDIMNHVNRNADFYDMYYLCDKQIMKIMKAADEIGKDMVFLSQPIESRYFAIKIRCLKQYQTPYYNMNDHQMAAA